MMFQQDSWQKDDPVVVNGKHGKITRFSSDLKKVYVEHKDNENNPYERWYTPDELPPYRPALPNGAVKDETVPLLADVVEEAVETVAVVEEKAIAQMPEALRRGVVIRNRALNYNRVVESVDGLTLTLAMGKGKIQWDSSVWEIVPPDADLVVAMLSNMAAMQGRLDELEAQNKEQRERLNKQAVTLGEFMKGGDDGLAVKYEQLEDDYEQLDKKYGELKKSHEQQAELLKQAAAPTSAFSTEVNQKALNDSLRAECGILHKENDKLKAELAKALKSPHEALELRLAKMEEKLEEAADWIEGAVERSMDEADLAAEKRVLELSQPSMVDYAPLFLVMAKAFASAGEHLKAVG